MSAPLRIAAFGFRSIPLREGCAGADTFAAELLPRLAARGHTVVAYNRIYPGELGRDGTWQGVMLKHLRVPWRTRGFDTLWHSARATWDIIVHDRADIVHLQNGGNSPFALLLRLAGKRVYLSQDGADWQRAKWPWHARLYLGMTQWLTAFAPHAVLFDNVFVREAFERRFGRRYDFIPFGADLDQDDLDASILDELGLAPGSYFLFVGRFIPDKGLQYLIPAFEGLETDKRLVLVGGSPNPSDFEQRCRATTDPRILFPGYVYGARARALMRHAYAYVQPSDIEGLSPVILQNMGLATPVICSDIRENLYVVSDCAITFARGDVDDLRSALRQALEGPRELRRLGARGRERVSRLFTWEAVAHAHEAAFADLSGWRAREARLRQGELASGT